MEDAVLYEKIVASYRLADFGDVIAAGIRRLLDDRGVFIAEVSYTAYIII